MIVTSLLETRPIEFVCLICVIAELISTVVSSIWDTHLFKYIIYDVFKQQRDIVLLKRKLPFFNSIDLYPKYAKLQRVIAAREKKLVEEREKRSYHVRAMMGRIIYYILRNSFSLYAIYKLYRVPLFTFSSEWNLANNMNLLPTAPSTSLNFLFMPSSSGHYSLSIFSLFFIMKMIF